MDRAEAAGLGVAAAGHLALLAALSLGFAATRLPRGNSSPIEVDLVTEEVALESSAPSISAEAPAPILSPLEGPPELTPAPPAPELAPAPQVQPAPQAPRAPPAAPTPQPRAAAPPAPAPARRPHPPRAASRQPQPARPAPDGPARAAQPARPAGQARGAAPRPTGKLNNILNGFGAGEPASKATAPASQKAGPPAQALAAEVRRQLKPHWQRVVPTGADAEDLRTIVTIHLGRDGRVTGIDEVRTTGITASNRPQVALHQERAKKAVTLASPFRLPAEYYDAWKEITATLDLRLSQ
jgi:outer membrane biosynthesis protein TonB